MSLFQIPIKFPNNMADKVAVKCSIHSTDNFQDIMKRKRLCLMNFHFAEMIPHGNTSSSYRGRNGSSSNRGGTSRGKKAKNYGSIWK